MSLQRRVERLEQGSPQLPTLDERLAPIIENLTNEELRLLCERGRRIERGEIPTGEQAAMAVIFEERARAAGIDLGAYD